MPTIAQSRIRCRQTSFSARVISSLWIVRVLPADGVCGTTLRQTHVTHHGSDLSAVDGHRTRRILGLRWLVHVRIWRS